MRDAGHRVNGCPNVSNRAKFAFDSRRRKALLTSIMKRLLSLLMCYVFLQAETFALRGGPSSRGVQRLQGSYSVIMLESSIDPFTGKTGTSVGLALLTAPAAGATTGSFITFSFNGGTSFIGTINGLSSTAGQLTSVLSGSEINGTGGSKTVNGSLLAKIAPKQTGSVVQEITGTASTRVTTLVSVKETSGTPPVTTTTIFVVVDDPIYYTVSGYQTDGSGASFSP